MRLRALAGPIVVVLLALTASRADTDPTGHYLYLSPAAGFTTFDGDLRFPNGPLKDERYLGGRLGYPWWKWLALEAAGGATSTHENALGGEKISFWHASGNVVFTPWRGLYGMPFLTAGYGISKLKHDDPTAVLNIPGTEPGTINQGNAELGGGFQLWMTDALGVRFEHRHLAWISHSDRKILTHTFVMTAGLTYALGGHPRDTDRDGLPDRRDDCPNTLAGAKVNARGCPNDSDGDGVLDGLDACPDTPKGATIDARGCPSDADQDGVFDGLDQSADTPRGARVDAKGCPSESDHDGVLDGIDRCENTPAGAKVDATGCPIDSDGDGVPDGIDQCPNTTKGLVVDPKGCPISYVERETELLDTGMIRLQNVTFETGKADLKPESLPVLDSVGDLLSQWPDLKIEIGGHTDSRGSAKLNARLSQARADSVRAYMLRRFPRLSPEQYVTKGYGPSQPIAPNDTEGGRAQNRRVEFVVLNKGMLMKEIERRRELQKPAGSDSLRTPAPPDTTGGSGKP